MIQEIRKSLFQIKIPLPGSSLDHLNVYVVRSQDRNLIIDTGMNKPVCKAALLAGLAALGIDLRDCDFFITHLHHDHIGLLSVLETAGSTIFFNRPDADIVLNWTGWEPLAAFAQANGYPTEQIATTLGQLPGADITERLQLDFTFITDGERLAVGDYRFECIETPGHSFGHICLYEPECKLLIAGDHLLADISPSLQCWEEERDALKDYFHSLDRVSAMDIDLVLPGHRDLITDCRGRAAEIRHHHQQRCEEVMTIVTPYLRSGFEVASLMSWDLDCDSWEYFPPAHKWFAFGEAMAHLKYLQGQGCVTRTITNNVAFYYAA